MKAANVMNREVVTIKGADTVATAITLMQEKQVQALIVDRRHDEDAYGIVTEADIVYKVTAYGKDPQRVRIYEIMTKPCLVVNPDLAVEYVARLFAQFGIHRAPVIQEHLLGIISLTDILSKAHSTSEEPAAVRLEKRIQQAIAEARAICEREGATSRAGAIAWDTVEELQAEAAHQRAERLPKTAFEVYCEEFPEALEARMYDV
jgi:CBS domain-containing protein